MAFSISILIVIIGFISLVTLPVEQYPDIAPLSNEYAKNLCGAPHSWHAAEMFMYLIEKRK